MDPNYHGSYSICGSTLFDGYTKLELGEYIDIHSSYYPNAYRPDSNCKTMVYSEHQLILEFHDMNIEDWSDVCIDYLSVDGRRYCGRSIVS